MSENEAVMDVLKEILDRLRSLEERVESLAIGQFTGAINTGLVNIAQGVVNFKDSEFTGLAINATDVEFTSEVDSVQIEAKGKVAINGEVQECYSC